MSWDDWANLRASARPTVRPPTAVQPPVGPVVRHPPSHRHKAPVAAKQRRAAWGAQPSPTGAVVALSQVLSEGSKVVPQVESAATPAAADGLNSKTGRSKANREGSKLSPAQQAEVRRCFGQYAEHGLMVSTPRSFCWLSCGFHCRSLSLWFCSLLTQCWHTQPDRPSHFVSIDPRKLDVALRELKLSPRLSDSQTRAIVAARRQSSRGRGAVDLLEFTKIVASKVVATGRNQAAVGAQRSQPREPVPVTVAPWLNNKPSLAVSQVQSEADVANFPKLGATISVDPPAAASSQSHAQPSIITVGENEANRAVAPSKSNNAPPAGTLARQIVAAALAAAPAEPVRNNRGWERMSKVDAESTLSLCEKQPTTKCKGKGKPRIDGEQQKSPGKKTRFKDPRLNEFWGSALDDFWVAKQSKSKGKNESRQVKKKGKRQDGQLEINLKKGKLMKNPNSASSAQIVARRGVERATPKKKRLSKLKRIILEDRERKYIDLLVYRWVYSVFSARIMVRRLQRSATGSTAKIQPARIVAVDVSRYLMTGWLKKKRKQLLYEAAVAQGIAAKQSLGDEQCAAGGKEQLGAACASETLAGAVDGTEAYSASAGAGAGGSATEDSATEDSATEDSATEDETTPGILTAQLPTSVADSCANEESTIEDGNETATDQLKAQVSDSATEDSATEDDEAGDAEDVHSSGTRVQTADLQMASTEHAADPVPTNIPVKYKPRVELTQCPANCLKVTLGNLPAGIKWPALKIVLVEKCGAVEHARLFDDASDADGTRRCIVNFQNSDSVSAVISLMGVELLSHHPLKVDYAEKRGPWPWLPEPNGDDAKAQDTVTKVKKVENIPSETAQQAAERRLKIPRIAPAVMREYCKQVIAPGLNVAVTALLQKLKFFQDRLKAQDPVKAKMRKRFVLGLREVRRGVLSRKVKCVIMTPNIEQVGSQGGLDGFVSDIMTECEKDREDGDENIEIDRIPLVFALTRNKLGKALGKPMTLSVVGLYDVNGAFEEYKEMLSHAATGREAWLREQACAQAQPKRRPTAAPAVEPKPKLQPDAEQRADDSNSGPDPGINRRLNANAPAFNAQAPPFQWRTGAYSPPLCSPDGYAGGHVSSIVAGLVQQISGKQTSGKK